MKVKVIIAWRIADDLKQYWSISSFSIMSHANKWWRMLIVKVACPCNARVDQSWNELKRVDWNGSGQYIVVSSARWPRLHGILEGFHFSWYHFERCWVYFTLGETSRSATISGAYRAVFETLRKLKDNFLTAMLRFNIIQSDGFPCSCPALWKPP